MIPPNHHRTPAVRALHAGGTRERGQVLALFAIGALVLIGAIGLGIDSGRTFEDRRAAQTAVDHAATAAAFASCTGSDVATSRAAGMTAATRNGYDDAAPAIVVTVDPVVGEADTFKAAINSTIDGTFARVLGINTFTVSVEATAGGVDCGASGVGPGAMYGGGTCESGKGVELSGSNMTIEGSVHSNSDLKIAGDTNNYDEVTFVDDKNVSGASMTFAPAPPTYPLDVGPSMPSPQWPAGWAPSDANALFAAYKALAAANLTDYGSALPPDTITKDGVWFTSSTSKWVVKNLNGHKVVLVSQNGEIELSDGNQTMDFWDDPSVPRRGIVALSGVAFGNDSDRCSKPGIKLSGQNWIWSGILWAPDGLVEFSGSDNATGDGSLISWGMKLSGQYITIKEDPTLFQSDPSVLLLK